jgi:DNA-binding NarL/FixJ family response regulator
MPPLTVVVVDDATEYIQVVRLLLLRLPDLVTVVGEAANGEEALALILRKPPDIVITDLVMPGLDGIGLTKHIRRELPQTSVILMSSFTEDAYRLMASDSGADSFVHKGVLYDALVPAIRDLIGRRLPGGSGTLPPTVGGSSASAPLQQ